MSFLGQFGVWGFGLGWVFWAFWWFVLVVWGVENFSEFSKKFCIFT